MDVHKVYETNMQHFNCRIEQITSNVMVTDVTGRWRAESTTCRMVQYDSEQSTTCRMVRYDSEKSPS